MSKDLLGDTFTFSKRLTSSTGTELTTILNLPPTESLYPGISADYYVGVATYLETLQATINLKSFPLAPTPAVLPEDSQSERQGKILEIQNKFAKVGLSIQVDSGEGFVERSLAVIQNHGTEVYLPLLQPFLTMSETQMLKFTDRIAMQIVNLGNGLLGNNDSILIQGSFRQARTLVPRVVGVFNKVYSGVYSPAL